MSVRADLRDEAKDLEPGSAEGRHLKSTGENKINLFTKTAVPFWGQTT